MTEKNDNKTIKTNAPQKNSNFETKQNLLGFFDLLLKIDMRNKFEKIYNIKIFLRIQSSFIFLIFTTLFFLKNEYSYSMICLFFIFLYSKKEKIKEISINWKDVLNAKFYK